MPPVDPQGPLKVARPFQPIIGEDDPATRIAHALEHIASALSALDHNVEVIARLIKSSDHMGRG